MLNSLCAEFKAYHYDIVGSLVSDEEAAREVVVFDEHQRKTMEYIDCLGDLLAKPQLDIPSPLSTNNRLVDRHLDSLEDSARDIRRAIKTRGIGKHILTNYLVKIASLEGELQGLKREILSTDDCEE